MPHVHVLHSPDPSGSIRQLNAVVPELSAGFRFSREEAKPGGSGLWAVRKTLAANRPDVLHTIGPGAFHLARWLQFTERRRMPKWVASGVSGCGSGWDLIRHATPLVDAVITHSPGESRLASHRIRSRCIHTLRPAVTREDPSSTREMELPQHYILASGGFDAVADLKSIVWAFDALRYTQPGLHLIILGDGPQRRELERFARSLAFDDYRVQFLGWQSNVTPFIEGATAVWSTHTSGGNKFLLEAMSAGKLVAAVRNRDTEMLIRDGVTGVLVAQGDPVGLASVTRGLLADRERVAAIGRAAKSGTSEYPVAELVKAYAAVYHRLIGSTAGTRSSFTCSATC